MTAKMTYDHFPLELQECERRFWAVLLEDVALETRDNAIETIYSRGIYSFPTKHARNVFTKVCNDDRTETVAYRFNRKPERKETENED